MKTLITATIKEMRSCSAGEDGCCETCIYRNVEDCVGAMLKDAADLLETYLKEMQTQPQALQGMEVRGGK